VDFPESGVLGVLLVKVRTRRNDGASLRCPFDLWSTMNAVDSSLIYNRTDDYIQGAVRVCYVNINRLQNIVFDSGGGKQLCENRFNSTPS
jgi:hypothetical protein